MKFKPMKKQMVPIAVFTGGRADYGLLHYLIQHINKSELFDLKLIVSGSHLSYSLGFTASEIYKHGIPIASQIQLPLDSRPPYSAAAVTGHAMSLYAQELEKMRPEYIVVLGDRYEAFAAASSAHLLNIKVIHIHGGETTLGAFDDRIRHAISQLSTTHFTSMRKYAEKLINMGIPEESVFNIGPMAIDGILTQKRLTRSEFSESTGYIFGDRNIIVTYHPVTLLEDKGLKEFGLLLESLARLEIKVLFTAPNADPGSEMICTQIEMFCKKYPEKSCYIKSLGQQLYLDALHLFEAMAGNTSSGLLEASLIGIPVVNIGPRQEGRARSPNVYDVSGSFDATYKALTMAIKDGQQVIWPRKGQETLKSPSKFIIKWLESQHKQSAL